MPHPRMYDDGDPCLVTLRPLCLRLPEAVEVEAWGRPTFRAGKRIFATFGFATGGTMREQQLIIKPDPAERPALVADERFEVPPYFGASGWLGLDLGRPDTDWDEVAELVEASYRQVALKRMLAALDAGPARST